MNLVLLRAAKYALFWILTGWVNALVAGEVEGAKGFMFFICNMELTTEGLSKSYATSEMLAVILAGRLLVSARSNVGLPRAS